jgi:hypothetical protein
VSPTSSWIVRLAASTAIALSSQAIELIRQYLPLYPFYINKFSLRLHPALQLVNAMHTVNKRGVSWRRGDRSHETSPHRPLPPRPRDPGDRRGVQPFRSAPRVRLIGPDGLPVKRQRAKTEPQAPSTNP